MEQFDELASAQKGLLLYHQGVELFGRRGLNRFVLDGALLREHHGLYRVAGTPITTSLVLVAASLLFDAVASVGAAAWCHGFDGIEVLRPEITVLGEFTGRRIVLLGRRVTVHRTNVLPPEHRSVVNGIAVTSPARTVCDLSRRYDAAGLGKLLDNAVRRDLVGYQEVRDCADTLRARGRRRTTIVDEVLNARGFGFDPGESDPELKIRTWLEDAGMPPEVQVEVAVGGKNRRLDLAYVAELVAVEYQGIKAHANEAAVIDDSRRTTELQLAGWLVVLITKADSRNDVIRRVREALQQRRGGVAP